MRQILLILATLSAFGQATTPFKVSQSSGSLAGQLWLQEPRASGTNWLKLRAGALAADVEFTLPTGDGQANDCLQTDGAGQWVFGTCGAERLVSNYNWSQVLGARSGSGAITLTFTGTNCPAAGTDVNYKYRLYETSTPTTYELATSNGTGTCTRGGAGTIVATGPTGTYTNATATSASSGWQEAVFSVADGLPLRLRAGVGGYYVYSDILVEDRYLTAVCDGPGALLVPMENNVRVLHSASPGGIRVSHCGFNNVYAKTGTKAIYTYNPDGNSFGSLIYDNNISAFETCVDLQTVYGITGFAYNRMVNCTDTALFLSNIETGDAGIGLIGPGNIFSDSVVGGANYGIHWNGPGNLKVVNNSFNGYKEQIRLAPKMGVVNVVGTAVTRVSGPEFRASMVGGGFVASSTVADTVASVTDGTNLVLTSNAVTCTGCIYYVGNTGQMQITGNTMDSWTSTTHNIRAVSDLPFYNFQFDGNFFSNPNTSTYAAGVSVEGAGFYFGSIKHNNLQTSYTVAEAAIDLSGGNYIDVGQNQIVNHLTGVKVGAAAVGHTLEPNHCTNNATTTNCITSASSSTLIHQSDPITYTQLAALSAANGSTLYCSNCKQTSASSATCATGGSGARATRINGAWKCDDGSAADAFIQGGNSFGATAELGTNDAYGLSLKTDGTGRWSIPTTGHLYAGTNNTYDIGAGLSANSPRSVYAATSMVTPKIGRDSSASFTIMTDSADRWIVNSAGMLYPAANDTYDIGLTGTRVRGVYGKFGEFYKSGSTASADYLTTRKYNILDQSGGSGAWDIQASGSMAATSSIKIRDNAGSRWLEAYRAIGGSPLKYTSLFGHLYPAKRLIADGDAVDDSVFGDLGATSARWANIYGAAADLSGALTATGNITGAIINATGSPAYRVNGTTVIDSTRAGSLVSLAVTDGLAGYLNLTNVVNSTQGVYGSCMALSATDTATTNTYVAGRICGRYDTASFTDELITIQTATGVGAYDTAISIKNQAVTVPGVLDAATFNATGSPAYRVNGTTVINASREATFAGLTIATGAASGYVWTSDASGVGSWQAASGGALPVVDTTGIAKGSSDATKIVRFEVDGLTTGTTRVLTVPDVSMTLAGRDVAQTFTAAQTYNSTVAYASTISSGVSPTTTLAYDFGSSSLRWATAYVGGINASVGSTFAGNVTVSSGSSLIMDRAARTTNQQFYWGVAGNVATTGAWAVGLVPSGAASTFVMAHNGTATATVSEGGQWDFAGIVTTGGALTVAGSATANRFNATNTNPFQVNGTTVIDASRNASFVGLTLNGSVTGDIIPATSAVYVLGSSTALWNNVHADVMTVYTSLLPDASASANLGGGTRRWTKTWTGDLDITGTITPPSGTAFTGTKTVRASGGASDCTLTFSAGIMTGGTC